MKLTGKALSILVVICFAFFAFSCAEKEDTEALKKQIEQLSAEKADLEAKVSSAAAKAAAPQVYKLAFSGAITGTTSDVGVPYSKAIEDYCKFVNDEKMLGDDKLECFIRDDGYKTENTKRNFEDFLDEGIVLYWNYSTGSTLALGKDFDEEQIPTITASFHAGNLDNSSYVFVILGDIFSQGNGLAGVRYDRQKDVA